MTKSKSTAWLAAAALAVGTGVVWVATLATAPAASAAVSPIVSRPAGAVTADALPTVQIDGVAWSQAVVGNTVYVGGQFTTARPAGAAPGVNTTTRNNLLAYDLTTGALITTFAPNVNGAVRSVVASPDGTKLYIGGSFTTVNGLGRSRIAAYNIPAGTVNTTFKPAMSTTVNAIVATNTTVYAGGVFTSAAGVARNRLAAMTAATGAVTAWDPNADYNVNALVMTPDGTEVIAGGAFQNVGGQPEYGLAATDATTGAVKPWAANQTVRNAGVQAAIESLNTDGTSIYGTGYVFGSGGNLEGTFSADPDSGTINWIESCHGDTYSSYAMGGLVYVVGHVHFCGDVGGYPQTDTPWNIQRAIAFTTQATGTLIHDGFGGYHDWFGQPSPSLVNWFPDLLNGTFTGQGQAAWNVTGNSQYVVMGGEFPYVNGAAQQGLVRFAVPSIAPNLRGPVVASTNFVPNLLAQSSTSVRVGFESNWDRDDQTLTYNVYRNGAATPIWTSTINSQFWNRPMQGFTDTGLTPGATYSYQVAATDPGGRTTKGTAVSITLPSTDPAQSAYSQQVLADGPTAYLPADESTGTTSLYDHAGYNDSVVSGGVTRGASGPIAGVPASTFDGSSGEAYGQTTAVYGPTVFSVEAWFQTTTTRGGEIVGFGSAQTGLSQNNDRKIYMDNAGHLYFGLSSGGIKSVHTNGTYNNGQWHHVVATVSSSAITLYVDGTAASPLNAGTAAQTLYPGYWRVGGDSLSGYPGVTTKPASSATSPYFAGNIGQVAIYPTALSAAKVAAHFAARSSSNAPPVAAFTPNCTDLTCTFDSSATHDPDGSISSYSWTFGDGGVSTAASPVHAYVAGGTYSVKLVVTDNHGAPGTVTVPVTVQGPNQLPTAVFTDACTDLACTFDGSTSHDSDGTIASYAWTFGDPAHSTSTAAKPNFTYLAGGTYSVSLTVTDDRGGTNTSTQSITVTAPNQLPTAVFTKTCTNLACSFDGTTSSDSDGNVVGYAWTASDGFTSTDPAPSHTFATAGSKTMSLTVTDDRGGTNTTQQTFTVSAANQLPTAVFTSACTNLTCNFDGSTSHDSDGTIASYAWDFGDPGHGTSAISKPSYTFPAGGTYTVTLTVTDNASGTATVTHDVVVTPSTVTQYATDLFGRTATGGWGTADLGGAWTVAGGTTNFSVASGAGQMKMATAGTQPSAFLNTLSLGDTNSLADFSLDKAPTGGGYYAYLSARHKSTGEYRIRAKILASGAIQLSLTKVVSGTETVLSTVNVAGVTYTAGMTLRMRLQVAGTSSVALNGKVWVAGTTEPAAWQVSTTDATSPNGPGAPGVIGYLSGSSTNAPVTVTWDNVSVTAIP